MKDTDFPSEAKERKKKKKRIETETALLRQRFSTTTDDIDRHQRFAASMIADDVASDSSIFLPDDGSRIRQVDGDESTSSTSSLDLHLLPRLRLPPPHHRRTDSKLFGPE